MSIDEIAKTRITELERQLEALNARARITELEREVEALNARVKFLKGRQFKVALKNPAMIGQLALKRIDNDYPIDF